MAELPLTTRQCSILNYLLQVEDAIPTSEIASQLEITPRMVRYDLNVIENWLDDRNILIERKPGFGIQVIADDKKKKLLTQELQQFPDSQIILSHNERQELLLFLLLTSKEPVVLKQLKLKLGVSRSTILQDIDKTETWLGMHGLFLTRRPSFGFQVEGKVIYRCEALIAFLLDKVGVMPILALCIGSRKSYQEQMQGKTMLSRAILDVFSALEIEYCASLVSATQRTLNVRFTDNSFVTLALQIALQIIRLKHGGVREDDLGIISQKEIEAAQQIAKKIEQRYNLTYPDAEKAYLSAQLFAARSSRSVRDIRGDEDSTTHDEAIMDIVSEILTIASEYLHPYLKIDRELERSLLFHLEPVMERLRIDMPIRNPLLDDVKRSYRYIFEVASRASEVLG